jgi:hypothetical protein
MNQRSSKRARTRAAGGILAPSSYHLLAPARTWCYGARSWASATAVRRRSYRPRAVLGLVARCAFAKHWGETGGTPERKDGEIRVRMGKSKFQPWLGRGAATGVFGKGCIETKGFKLAPQVRRRYNSESEVIPVMPSSGLCRVTAFKSIPGPVWRVCNR